jgi:hypothetical protein
MNSRRTLPVPASSHRTEPRQSARSNALPSAEKWAAHAGTVSGNQGSLRPVAVSHAQKPGQSPVISTSPFGENARHAAPR